MLLVLAVITAHVLCSTHLNEQAAGAGHSHVTAVQSSEQGPAAADTAVLETASTETPVPATPVAEVAPAASAGASHGCSDHHPVAAQYEPVLLPAPAPAAVPELAMQWLVSDLARHEPPVRSSVTVAAAPSLTALGISRT